MARHTVRLEDWQSDGIEQLAREHDLSKSDLLRRAVSSLLKEWEDEVPEHVRREANHDELVRQNKPFLRGMHFKQRVYEYLVNCLTNEEGHIARYAPHPDKVDENYGEQIKQEVRREYPEYEEEFIEHIDDCLEWYRTMHPDTRPSGDREFLIELARHHMARGREKEAKEAVENMIQRLGLKKSMGHEILDEARNRARDEKWKAEWDRSVRGDS